MCPVPAPGSHGTRKPAQVSPSRENDMKFRPLHDRILDRRIESEEKTAGGGMDY
jgi:chaperonin GroES